MKRIILLLVLICMGTYLSAQTLDTVRIVSKAKKFRPHEYILVQFEVLDTTDASGQKITMSRSYYFDNQHRKVSSVREYHNPRKPEKGTQLIYSFAQNKLSVVTVIPPKSTCRNCESRYYFTNDSLASKQENRYRNADPSVFIKQSHVFLSKLPEELPWGFFDDEVILNGKRKKLKRQY